MHAWNNPRQRFSLRLPWAYNGSLLTLTFSQSRQDTLDTENRNDLCYHPKCVKFSIAARARRSRAFALTQSTGDSAVASVAGCARPSHAARRVLHISVSLVCFIFQRLSSLERINGKYITPPRYYDGRLIYSVLVLTLT